MQPDKIHRVTLSELPRKDRDGMKWKVTLAAPGEDAKVAAKFAGKGDAWTWAHDLEKGLTATGKLVFVHTPSH